ncbi:MAG: ABC transporter permease [Planctomycetota bacterium]
MNKVLAVAKYEYLIAVTSKAFLLGVVMMPVFMGGAIVVQYLTRDQVDLTARKIAVVDKTGRLFDVIEQQNKIRNEFEIFETDEDGGEPRQTRAEFSIERVEPESDEEELGIRLSDRIRSNELFAFAVIEEDVFDPSKQATVRYYSQTPSYQTLPNWIERVVNGEVKRERTEQLGLSNEDVLSLARTVPTRTFGLIERDGEVKEENRVLTFMVPFGGLMLMFMMVMSVAPAMLNNVLEEKMQKISEFLVSSVTPFQLMLGKLFGAVGVGLTLSTIYLGAAYGMARYFEIDDRIPFTLYLWFAFFVLLALVIFGSIFSAIGAACSEIRDAQSLMTPVMLLVIIPMMCMAPILDSPSSTFSRAISLFPPATPMLMFARIAIPPGPALWEIVLAVILTALFAAGCVWAAGKVFRVGILSQGQAPSFAKLVSWVLTK